MIVDLRPGTTEEIEADLSQEIIDRIDGDAATLAAAQFYTDASISGIPPVDLSQIQNDISDLQDADVDLQSQINTEKGRVDAILDMADADKDSFAEIVALINSIDTENDQAFAGYVASNDARVLAVEDNLAQEILDRQAADAAEAALRESADDDLQDQIDDLEVFTAATQSDVDDLEVFTASIQADLDVAEAGLAQEILDRTAADAALQAEVDSVEAGLAQEILDRAAADVALQAEVDAVEAGLAQEILDRTAADSSLQSAIDSLQNFNYEQVRYVAKNGDDNNTGGQHSPFLTVSAALASITDASPTKRYAIRLAAGNYTEASVVLKANVFIVGDGQKETVRLTGAVSLDSSFSGGADNRSGFSNLILMSAADFNWQTVTSAAGKLYFNEVSFNSSVSMYGHNNATAQAQFANCIFFGNLTVSGINVGVFADNVCFGNIVLNQHPNGGMATVLNASGGYCSGSVTLTTTVNDFNRRCGLFARSFYMGSITVDGPSSYADMTDSSIPSAGPTALNGGNVVYINAGGANKSLSNLAFPTAVNQPIMPANTNATNFGDWGKQWFWNFGYVHASTGTDLFLISYGSSFGADSSGKSIGIVADGAGLQADVDGGEITLQTATASGTGVRGKIILDGREIDVTSKQIKNLADGTDNNDAVNKSQLDAAIASSSGAVAAEAALREAADDNLQDQIDDLDVFTASLQSDIDDLDAFTASIQSDLDVAEAGLAQEILDRTAADSGLQSQITTEKARVDAILDSADADKDTFVEIVALINSIDTENDQAFAGYVLSNDARVLDVENNLAQEILDRAAADTALQAEVDAVEAGLAQELLDRAAGDTNTLSAANTYTDNAIAAIPPVDLSQIESDIDDLEVFTAAIQSDVDDLDVFTQSIQSDLDVAEAGLAQEILDRVAADSALDALIDDVENGLAQEVVDRTAADASLQSEIDLVDAALTNEVTARDAADTILQSNIDTVNSALAQEVLDRAAADTALQAEVDAVEAGLAQELLDRAAADTTLQSNIDSEETARIAADADLQSQIDDLDVFTASIRSDLDDVDALASSNAADIDSLEVRVQALEDEKHYLPHLMNVPVATATEQAYVDCDHTADVNTLSVYVDAMKAHYLRDFSVSVESGKTRITWINTFAVGGVEEVAIGETIYISYNYEV